MREGATVARLRKRSRHASISLNEPLARSSISSWLSEIDIKTNMFVAVCATTTRTNIDLTHRTCNTGGVQASHGNSSAKSSNFTSLVAFPCVTASLRLWAPVNVCSTRALRGAYTRFLFMPQFQPRQYSGRWTSVQMIVPSPDPMPQPMKLIAIIDDDAFLWGERRLGGR
jgi:hypothetical protein